MDAIRWQGVVDFAVLAVAVYLLLQWSREARALRLALVILALRVGALVAGELDLLITTWVLDTATIVALLTLLVVFQPELRRALMRLDVVGRTAEDARASGLPAVSDAAWSLARVRCGALIVVARKDALTELISSGVPLGGRISAGVLEAIFRKDSPVHDGAAILEGGAISRVGAVLPLTQRTDLPGSYGTRHRAAIGLAERSDALVVVVSEERGGVTLMWGDHAQPVGSPDELTAALRSLVGEHPGTPVSIRRVRPAAGLAAAAVAVAALVWSLTFLLPGGAVRARTIPLEFTDVPPRLAIAEQSINTVQVWLRGNAFLLDAISSEDLVARCSLAGAREGQNRVPIAPDTIDVPFGVQIEGIQPSQVSVRLQSPATSQPPR